MISNMELAKNRMADRMREAQAAQLAYEATAPERAMRRAKVHRMVVATLGLIVWPMRH
jgi:hypothetical protein